MCPGRGMLHGYAPTVPHVTMWSDKIMPYGFANGGVVHPAHVNIPDGVLKPSDPDRVLVRLMPGELIIPTKHVPMVGSFLRKKGIKLPGLE